VRRAIADALDGDRHARRWLGDILIGKECHEMLELLGRQAELRRQIADYREGIIARFLEQHPEVQEAARRAGLLPEALPPPERNLQAGDDGNGVLE
jgi:hypothetical protein